MNRTVIPYMINDILNWHQNGELVLSPYFQRRDVWANKAKSSLIDTIVRNLPIPIIIVRQSIDPKTGKTIREVVDGQQRLRAIIEFSKNELQILRIHNKELGGLNFTELELDTQESFRAYLLSINVVQGASDAEILDIFARLNSYTLTLNNQENLNAKYHGEFKTFIYRESSQFLDFFKSNRILSNARIIRMGEAEFFSELIVAMIDGLQHGKKTLWHYYKEYDDEFPQAEEILEQFTAVITKIEAVFGEGLKTTIYRKSNLFYSLYCVFYDLMYGMEGQLPPQQKEIPPATYPAIITRLNYLSEQVESDVPEPNLVEFKLACTGHVDNLKERKVRHEYLKAALVEAINE